MNNHKTVLANSQKKHQEMTDELMQRFKTSERIRLVGCGVTHDLCNMIEQILIANSVLRSITPADNKQAQKLIAIIESSSTRAGEMLKKQMSDASSSTGERQKIHIDKVIQDIERALSCTFPANIRIDTDISKSLWPIYGSVIDIYQAITNVCLNARDAMPDGGELSLSVKNTTLDRKNKTEDTYHQGSKPYVCLRIADTGVGIPQDQLSLIFQPYYSRKQNGLGTGLGLYNVRKTIESHSGFVTVESLPNNGTVFYLYFPAMEIQQL